ncbi:MAG: sugar kinase [Pseudomonadota bacterium]
MARITVFGEPLLELASTSSGSVLGPSNLGIAGDTLNTSVYLSRLGHDVNFVTALGSDAYSDALKHRLREEGVGTENIIEHPKRVPGLYAIRTDHQGERFFTYWRDHSAARAFFDLPDADRALRSAVDSDLLYFSGISMAILTPTGRSSVLEIAGRCADSGIAVAFDGNYRPYGWEDDETARQCLTNVGKIATMVLPTSEDDDKLFGEDTPIAHAKRWREFGTSMVIVKNGPDGAWLLGEDLTETHIAVDEIIKPTDTTGAGDSFNAGFLAAILDGQSPTIAAASGNRLAGQVIQHRGALIPHEAMPA